ncbi:unnamed protein product [Angiostrongylus costaricensis]|uniref:ATP-grasp domain-containing protein n=1 Tax=Angiostrongylus costaricensis TaxID=334426 RepID=A0A0R3PGS0_ANGCS|nr:unnamed protein product [Angiostrongylus costaricensis]
MEQLVQEYVSDPFLMKDQLKFDFRVYGVIKSLNPLSIYVSREGMARFCTMKYEKPAPSNFNNLFSHLTNYSLNKASQTYVHSNSIEDQVTGSKRLLSTVFYQMGVCGIKTKKLWHDVKLIIVKTVLAMVPELMIHYEHQFHRKRGPHCFQIVGFDIMVREDGSPVLLEVNASPSLSIEHSPHSNSRQKSIVDEVIKIPLVRDTLLLVTVLHLFLYCSRSTDDLKVLKMAKRPYLSEIFPNRYGCEVADLLFLDQMVYIFMQYANLRLSTTIGVPSLKRIINVAEFSRGILRFLPDLSFHGFVSFMIFLANRRFHGEPTLQDRLTCLIKTCVSALRHKGVRSRRLRREEVHEKSGGLVLFYLCSDFHFLSS